MAISDVSATHKDAVSTFLESLEDLVRPYGGRAQCSNGSEVWWILKTAHPCQIGAGISAPIAQKTNDCRFELFTGHSCSPEVSVANKKNQAVRILNAIRLDLQAVSACSICA